MAFTEPGLMLYEASTYTLIPCRSMVNMNACSDGNSHDQTQRSQIQ